ncbi:ornithine cyclodeaminase family protein [Lysinibacillus sp. FW12]|uniref:ornithine cyclodeaminase family protein n=1 Tax=Lysinibacillus sp. FW12 TaxID=3096079 RepID=UPI003D7379A9
MLILNEEQIMKSYNMKNAIEDVRKVLKAKVENKIADVHRTVIDFPDHDASALYMPSADLVSEVAAVKVVTIFPKNSPKGMPTTQGVLLLTDAENGSHVAMMNASYLTRLRTGALSGIATDYLSKKDATILTVIGTGGMAFEQVLGVLAVRSITKILLVNKTTSKAHRFGEKLKEYGVKIPFEVIDEVSVAVKQADIICCATRSTSAVLDGEYLKPGTHINGIGSYLPTMREIDETTILKANKIVVDDHNGVKNEAGEFIHAAEKGIWSFDKIYCDLGKLVTETKNGREDEEEITIFKSVGAAYYDLAVAKGVYQKAKELGIGIEIDM